MWFGHWSFWPSKSKRKQEYDEDPIWPTSSSPFSPTLAELSRGSLKIWRVRESFFLCLLPPNIHVIIFRLTKYSCNHIHVEHIFRLTVQYIRYSCWLFSIYNIHAWLFSIYDIHADCSVYRIFMLSINSLNTHIHVNLCPYLYPVPILYPYT